jgi:CxxC motif-containing protein (DUF1111 family)
VAAGLGWCALAGASDPAAKEFFVAAPAAVQPDGKEIFTREWLPGDQRAHGGDGLGPVFNDTSCVACHNQGGPGGGGPAAKNVDIVSVFAHRDESGGEFSLLDEIARTFFGGSERRAKEKAAEAAKAAAERKAIVARERKALAEIHPGFLASRSLVLHKASTDKNYAAWRSKLLFGDVERVGVHFFDVELDATATADLDFDIDDNRDLNGDGVEDIPSALDPRVLSLLKGMDDEARARALQALAAAQAEGMVAPRGSFPASVGELAFLRSQRNPTALFGAGKLDAVTDEAIVKGAERKYKDFPEVSGRVARLTDGRIGRFGWKGQTATLKEFVVTACAVELGLHVPGHAQAGLPTDSKYNPPGLDLDESELAALTAYVADLPPPAARKPADPHEAQFIAAGKELFGKVGCAACHVEDLGDAKGVYSDLLLHDMGPSLSDQGAYGVFVPNSGDEQPHDEPLPNLAGSFQPRKLSAKERAEQREKEQKTVGALRQEWRTSPLWAVRDSAPYLHDGRAATLEAAIALHGGEGALSAVRFFLLAPEQRMQVTAFLKSLAAP